jgi:DNA-binding response OmpR family regulator
MVREMAHGCLVAQGYHVIVAANGAEAMELAGCHQEPIHLLLTDLVMPQMNGRELAHAMRERDPDLQVLYMSGHPLDVLQEEDWLDEGMEFLPKPFTVPELLHRVRELLNRPDSNGL